MKRYCYKKLYIWYRVDTTITEQDEERAASPRSFYWSPTLTKINPEYMKFSEGIYEPPAGWRIVSFINADGRGIELILEQEIINTPYR